MVVNGNNPAFEVVYILRTFYVVAMTTARNAVFRNVSDFIVNSVNAVEYIRTICSLLLMNLIWFYTTVMTWLFSNPSKKLQVKNPLNFSVFGVVFILAVKLPKGGFSSWEFERASATIRVSPPKRICVNYLLDAARANTEKRGVSVPFVLCPSQNHPFSKGFSRQVNKTSIASTACRDAFSETLSANNRHVSAVALTKPSSLRPKYAAFRYLLPCSLKDNQPSVFIPNFVSNFTHRFTFLKGAPRMEIGIVVQAIRPIGARVKREVRFAKLPEQPHIITETIKWQG